MAKNKDKKIESTNQATGISSVLELSKWKPGDKPFWIILRPRGSQQTVIDQENEWAFNAISQCSIHPKVLYERKIVKGVWNFKKRLPKLHAGDFQLLVDVLTGELMVEVYDIIGVARCPNTGEFLYQNESEEWMPETNLFSTAAQAKRERARIKIMVKEWAKNIPQDLI